jgi:BirA family biotin operon repressor/biotin-[acetyl-CoA-carboxylase] ligase
MRSHPANEALAGRLAGTRFHVTWLDEVDSTNTYALAQARAGAAEGLVVVADHQTAGRGRLGRTWESPAGASLLLSVLLRPGRSVPVDRAHLLTVAAALAVADACDAVAGFGPALKWPNDVVAGDPPRKLAGILAEADTVAGGLAAVVVGVGVNANWPASLPDELRDTATSANHEAGRPVDRTDLLVAFLTAVERHYLRVQSSDGSRAVVDEYRARCTTIGRQVRVDARDARVEGVAIGVSDAGHLGVEVAAGDIRWFAAGDVTHVRTPA